MSSSQPYSEDTAQGKLWFCHKCPREIQKGFRTRQDVREHRNSGECSAPLSVRRHGGGHPGRERKHGSQSNSASVSHSPAVSPDRRYSTYSNSRNNSPAALSDDGVAQLDDAISGAFASHIDYLDDDAPSAPPRPSSRKEKRPNNQHGTMSGSGLAGLLGSGQDDEDFELDYTGDSAASDDAKNKRPVPTTECPYCHKQVHTNGANYTRHIEACQRNMMDGAGRPLLARSATTSCPYCNKQVQTNGGNFRRHTEVCSQRERGSGSSKSYKFYDEWPEEYEFDGPDRGEPYLLLPDVIVEAMQRAGGPCSVEQLVPEVEKVWHRVRKPDGQRYKHDLKYSVSNCVSIHNGRFKKTETGLYLLKDASGTTKTTHALHPGFLVRPGSSLHQKSSGPLAAVEEGEGMEEGSVTVAVRRRGGDPSPTFKVGGGGIMGKGLLTPLTVRPPNALESVEEIHTPMSRIDVERLEERVAKERRLMDNARTSAKHEEGQVTEWEQTLDILQSEIDAMTDDYSYYVTNAEYELAAEEADEEIKAAERDVREWQRKVDHLQQLIGDHTNRKKTWQERLSSLPKQTPQQEQQQQQQQPYMAMPMDPTSMHSMSLQAPSSMPMLRNPFPGPGIMLPLPLQQQPAQLPMDDAGAGGGGGQPQPQPQPRMILQNYIFPPQIQMQMQSPFPPVPVTLPLPQQMPQHQHPHSQQSPSLQQQSHPSISMQPQPQPHVPHPASSAQSRPHHQQQQQQAQQQPMHRSKLIDTSKDVAHGFGPVSAPIAPVERIQHPQTRTAGNMGAPPPQQQSRTEKLEPRIDAHVPHHYPPRGGGGERGGGHRPASKPIYVPKARRESPISQQNSEVPPAL
mmetsp:Transcript_24203/g.40595  ORF Transcript_24203/g.40595 Transcript_24203/m.40595 type:complete len:851 (+) Transcript_24203:218-2770(+)